MNAHRLTKFSLRIFVVSIILTAVVGIITILIPSKNRWYEVQILLTTLTIAGASIGGLICGGCLSRGHIVLPSSGLVLTSITAVLFLFVIWGDVESVTFWKTSLVFLFYAVACIHLSLLYMAKLAGNYRWSYLIAYQLILGLATLLAGAVIFNIGDSEEYWRFTAAISILVAAITLLFPVFHYLSRETIAASRAKSDPLFAVDEEIAQVKKRLIELENKRRTLLGRPLLGADDAPDR